MAARGRRRRWEVLHKRCCSQSTPQCAEAWQAKANLEARGASGTAGSVASPVHVLYRRYLRGHRAHCWSAHAGHSRRFSAGTCCLTGRAEQHQEAAKGGSISTSCAVQRWSRSFRGRSIPGSWSFTLSWKHIQWPTQAYWRCPPSTHHSGPKRWPPRSAWPGSGSAHSSAAAGQCSEPCRGAATAEGEDSGAAGSYTEGAGESAGQPTLLNVYVPVRAETQSWCWCGSPPAQCLCPSGQTQ